ncbi:MAG TPA: transposase [Mizugakiibacter sp.]
MSRYRRVRLPGATWFFTVNLARRDVAWLTEHIDILRDATRRVRAAHPFAIDAMVVLPEHLHAVWTLPAGDSDYALRWRLIKSAFSRAIPAGERRNASRIAKGERGIWQRRFWEHWVRDEDDLRRHIEYVHYNPVKHGHVTRAAAWPWSTFHRYVKAGRLALDWGVGPGDAAVEFGERA